MRRFACAYITLTCVLFAPAITAAAEEAINTVIYYRAGNWDVFSGSATNGGTFCGIKAGNPGDGRDLMLRFRTGGDRLVFRARKPSWQIPASTQIAVTMQIGPGASWNVTGTGEQDVVEWSIPQSDMADFDARFRGGAALWISFPNGNEVPWSVSLAGSTAASLTFDRCIHDLSARAAPSQPYGAGPTQPFAASNASQSPTQTTQPATPR